MSLVSSVDYPNKRITLGVDSVGVPVIPIDIYIEMRARRRLNADGDRNFTPLITAFGNESAGSTNTPRFANLADGVRIIPYDLSHVLTIAGALVSTSEALDGRDLFDRSSLSTGVEVDIDYRPPQVEIITIVSSGLTLEESQAIDDIRAAHYNRRTRDNISGQEIIYEDDGLTAKATLNTTQTQNQITEINPV